ncbi:lectin family glycoprotein receptor [Schizosaccharomyces cryophilus OY26]|uniref:Lectin family glycoprotein receptor n=1 Tax=Schizosaccharomyces cryophilus (strain OY26 / ATCC MYA-4695 / CBS 11777 / NBRC 106824 / NRRL Y48691) TaxID=653667 RepID=S9W835_SCHCR|nr:lectin family glycoprotein receptor [Schizosaccharomyces cryophilus OY26]EPY53880.1 lectin family glycoprotein receptor [Schizosaccharomyces cryophilus OY26]
MKMMLLSIVLLSFASLVLASQPQQNFLQLHSINYAIPLQWKWLGSVNTDRNSVYLTDKSSNSGADRYGALWANTPLSDVSWRMQTSYVAQASEQEAVKFGTWYTSTPSSEGPIYGSSDGWDGLLISQELDPTGKLIIRAVLNDKSISMAQFSDPDLLAFAKCTFEGMSNKLILADLAYSEQDGLSLTVNQQTCFSTKEVLLPKGYYLGVSSATSSMKESIALSNINVLDSGHFITNQPLPQPEQQEERQEAPVVQMHSGSNGDGESQTVLALQAEVQKLSSDVSSLTQRLSSLHVTTSNMLDRVNSLSSNQVSSERFQELEDYIKHTLSSHSSKSEIVSNRLTKFEQDLEKYITKSTSHVNFTNVLIVLILGVIVSYGVVIARRERRRHKYL